MCFMGSSKAEPPPPPPPPPAAPPTLEQEVPMLSDADEAAGLGGKSAGFKAYKIKKNNIYSASNDTASIGGVQQNNTSNY